MFAKLLNTSHGTIEYSIRGQGTPILILHGGHSNARETLTHKGIDPNSFCIITPSRPGYGKTSLFGNESPRQAAAFLVLLMDHLQFDSFMVIGISAGGPTAIALAAIFPQKVTRLLLISAVTKRWLSPQDNTYRKAQKLFHPAVEAGTWRLLRIMLMVFPRLLAKTMFTELSSAPRPRLRWEDIVALKTMLRQQRSHRGFITDLEHNLPKNLITQIHAPTVIIHSKNDNSVGLDHPKHAATSIKDATLIWLDNEWGHLIWIGKDQRKALEVIRNAVTM